MKIINKIVFFIALFSICINSYAWKVKSDSTIYAGFWGGSSFSHIDNFLGNTSLYSGFCGGVSIVFVFNPELAFRSGFSMINKGNCYQQIFCDVYGNSIGEYKTYNKFSYLSIPADLSFNLGRRKFNLFISAGFHLGILTKQTTYAKLPSTYNGNEVTPININNTDECRKLNFGINAGLGMEYKLKPNLIVYAELKYEHGFTNIYKVSSSYILKHRGYYAGVGVRFGIPITYSRY